RGGAGAQLSRRGARLHHGPGRGGAASGAAAGARGRAVHRRPEPVVRVPVHSGELRFSTDGNGDVVDLTDGVMEVVRSSGIDDGAVSVFVPGSTAAVTAMEYERGGVHDLRETLDRLVPPQGDYEHNRLN